MWGFSTADKSFALGQLLKVVHGGKKMFILIGTSPWLGIIARWGPLPVSMVLRSEESLKSAEMLSLARTSKYVKNTSVWSINTSEVDSEDRTDSSILIVFVVINSYSCFLLDKIFPMQKSTVNSIYIHFKGWVAHSKHARCTETLPALYIL